LRLQTRHACDTITKSCRGVNNNPEKMFRGACDTAQKHKRISAK
jgi:hypothetical protein